MNIAIIEDEKNQQELLTDHLKVFLDEKKIQYDIQYYEDGESFLAEYKKGKYDLIFMDIEFPKGLNGMDTSRKLRKIDTDVILIFVTNMAQFAVEGYSVDALDFIVKPVLYDPFRMKMEKALKIYSSNHSMKNILIAVENQSKQIMAKDIIYVEVSNHDLYYHTKDKEYKVKSSLKHAMSILGDLPFAQCNSCYLVNLEHVERVEKDFVVLDNDECLKMPRTRRKDFVSKLGNHLSGSRR
jgi:DNA-binding LytR/AlgR family response regulator